MPTKKYTIEIRDFGKFYKQLRKTHPNVQGAEWNGKTLTVFYEGEVPTIENIRIPTTIRFRKKLPEIPNATVHMINDNELVVETFNPEEARKAVKKKFPDFEEVK